MSIAPAASGKHDMPAAPTVRTKAERTRSPVCERVREKWRETMTETPNDVHALQEMPPLLHYHSVWHLGTTILTQKKPDSHAGSGLAVSRHPRSWRQIAGLAGPLFRFEKASGAFVDIHACLRLPHLMRGVWAWAQAKRYVTWQPLYQVRYYDTEEEGWHLLPFIDEGQARAEYQALRDDEREAQFDTLLGYAPTERMRAAMLHSTPPWPSCRILPCSCLSRQGNRVSMGCGGQMSTTRYSSVHHMEPFSATSSHRGERHSQKDRGKTASRQRLTRRGPQ